MKIRTVFLLFLFPWLPVCLFAHHPVITNFTKIQYGAANKNWSIGEDNRGTMYFGNDVGLLESDGIGWKLYRTPDSPIIRAIAVASHETIFTGGFEELGRWDRDLSGTLKYTSLRNLVKGKDFENENIWKIWIVNAKVYFQSFRNIYIYDYHTLKKVTVPGGFLFLLKVRNEYWVQETHGSLYRLKDEQLQKIEGSEIFKKTTARVILPHGAKDYLIGVSSGEIYLYDGKTFTLWKAGLSHQLLGKELNCGIYSAARKSYYLGTLLDGIYEISTEGELLNHFVAEDVLQNNTILSLYEDQQHNVWVAMDRGLAYIRYTDGLDYYKATERNAGAIYAAVEWRNNLLLATNQGVYYIHHNEKDKPDLKTPPRLIEGTQGQTWTFTAIGEKLYCAHNNGLIEIHPDFTASYPYPAVQSGVFKIEPVTIKGRELLLLVTYSYFIVIDKKSGKMWEMKQIADQIVNAEVDHLENIWLETASNGVYKCRLNEELNSFRYYTYYGQKQDNTLPARLRMSKAGGRITFLGNNHFYNYDEYTDKLLPNRQLNECFKSVSDLKRIVSIRDEQSWAITSTSIYRFSYDGYIVRILESYKINTEELSLVNNYENVSILNDSISFICLDAGFILHNTAWHARKPKKLDPPCLEAVQTRSPNGHLTFLIPQQQANIAYRDNSISIKYSVNNAFAYPLLVEYKLESEKDISNECWRQAWSNEISFDRLLRGNYVFAIRINDGLGNYSDTVFFVFSILAPWYLTVWAVMGYFVLFLFTSYLIWVLAWRRYRNQHLQKLRAHEAQHLRLRNEQLQDEVEERDAELFTQTSFIIRKNELIMKLQESMNDFSARNNSKTLLPLYQKMNQLLTNGLEAEDDWKMFLIKFEQKNQGFFRRLKEIHPQLTNNDLRLCACLKLNLETKDIASLMNLSVRAIENNRYRLRKKLDIKPTQNLNEYFLSME